LRNSIIFIIKDGAPRGEHAAQALALRERLRCASETIISGILDHFLSASGGLAHLLNVYGFNEQRTENRIQRTERPLYLPSFPSVICHLTSVI
jgi:hypothetical protein